MNLLDMGSKALPLPVVWSALADLPIPFTPGSCATVFCVVYL